jgi:hypothetical protein
MDEAELAAETALFQKFLVWTYDAMQPKRKDDALPRPESALQVALAIRRAHKRLGIETPPSWQIRLVLHCLELAFVEELGTAALLPRRKAPLTAAMLHSILALRSFSVNGRPFSWSAPEGLSIRTMFLTMWPPSSSSGPPRGFGRTAASTCAPARPRPTRSARCGAWTWSPCPRRAPTCSTRAWGSTRYCRRARTTPSSKGPTGVRFRTR